MTDKPLEGSPVWPSLLSRWRSSAIKDRFEILASFVADWYAEPEVHHQLPPLPDFMPDSLKWAYQTIARYGTRAFTHNYGGWTEADPLVVFHWVKRPEYLAVDESGVIEFLNENQGVYQCGVLTEGIDPRVVNWEKGDTRWSPLADCLTDFLLVLLVFELTLQGQFIAFGTFAKSSIDAAARNMTRLDFNAFAWMRKKSVSIICGDGTVLLAVPESENATYLQAAGKSQSHLESLQAFGTWESW
jgi:hypothetical protein